MYKTVYVVSDLHLGPGKDAASGAWNVLEDFRVDDEFCAFLDQISQSNTPVELVIAGDFVEYPQILPELAFESPDNKLGCSEAESRERTAVLFGQRPHIASGHPAVFARLRQFMERGHSITVLPGNHDVDILWDGVWAMLFDAIYPPGAAGELKLRRFSYAVGDGERGRVYIEHGHEHDPTNSFGDEMRDPFGTDATGVERLQRCWGTLFVDNVYNKLEQHYWFIDNVKPMSKVIKLGLRNDVGFTAPALWMILKFLFTSNAPFKEYLQATLSDEDALLSAEPRADELAATVADPDVRAYLQERLDDPTFRDAFERELRTTDAAEWREIRAGAACQPTLDQLGGEEDPSATLGWGDGEDVYRAAAHVALERDPRIATVIMGHTHGAIDGLVNPIYLDGQRTGYYFNSGTWTPHLRDQSNRVFSWAELAEVHNYTSLKTYLVLVPDSDGAYQIEMRNWGA